MPIFAYCCEACGHSFDALQKLGAAALMDCPECGASRLKKQLSAPAFHLKGKGWRKSDDRPKKPDVRPRYVHTLDSAVPHAEHHDHAAPSRVSDQRQDRASKADHSHNHGGGHDHGHGHSHSHHSHGDDHGHAPHESKPKGGLGKLVKAHVESANKGHSHEHSSGHSHGHSHGSGGHSHGPGGHTHAPKAGLKPAKKYKHD